MLPPVTKCYEDLSTARYYRFVFRCDCCGAPFHSEQYPFSLRDLPAGSPSAENARALLWKTEHDAAYERANLEALFHFSRCPQCGQRVCDSCFSAEAELCTACTQEKGGSAPHGQL